MTPKGGPSRSQDPENLTRLTEWQARGQDLLASVRDWLAGVSGRRQPASYEAIGVSLLIAGILMGLWLFAGWFTGSGGPAFWPWQFFGMGAPVLALALIVGGVALWLAGRLNWQPRWWAVAAGELLLVGLLALSHLGLRNPKAAATQGEGGGLTGWAISQLLISTLGQTLAWVVIIAWVLAAAWWLWRCLPPSWTGGVVAAVVGLFKNMGVNPEPVVRRVSRAAPARARAPVPAPVSSKPAKRSPAITKLPPLKVEPEPPAKTKDPDRMRRKSRPASLPPMDLLEPSAERQGGGNADARHQAQILQQTLAEFGVPVDVVSIKEGPTVTQFGLEPGETVRELSDGEQQRRRVSVSRILRLSNDLALALAAPSIRIEAPVPGRPYVGVEIPNPKKTLVGLRSVLEAKEFTRAGSPLAVALGRDVAGDPVVADLTRMPHLLIAGATGSGKSVCINTIVASLLMNNGSEALRLLMVDPKMVELPIYNGIPHLVAPVVTDPSQATGALAWLTLQMDERYRTFAASGVRNIVEYNNRTGKGKSAEALPYIVLVIDELADLMMTAAFDVERQICRLAQMARATGIHLVLATQRPSVDVITGLIKANFPARIAFAVSSQIDSRVILDTPGAEKLLGRGDMLFMAPDSSKLSRVQGCYVSDKEIDRLVEFWRASRPAEESGRPEALPWAGLLDQMEEKDAMLERALQVLHGKQTVSTSLLQRQLRLGYPRAARLMEQLEAMGVVGPDEGGGRSRQVLLQPDDEVEE
jgi:DNA segregation ATPase FtsK/SpoIIIE, S-DNA-T family